MLNEEKWLEIKAFYGSFNIFKMFLLLKKERKINKRNEEEL